MRSDQANDTRSIETDEGCARVGEFLESDGHRVAQREIVKDEPDEIRELIRTWLMPAARRVA